MKKSLLREYLWTQATVISNLKYAVTWNCRNEVCSTFWAGICFAAGQQEVEIRYALTDLLSQTVLLSGHPQCPAYGSIENIQSKVEFMAILLSSGVIHCQKHVYTFPCFIWIKNSSVWCCRSLPLSIIPTDTSLPHSMPGHVGSGRSLFFLMYQWSY